MSKQYNLKPFFLFFGTLMLSSIIITPIIFFVGYFENNPETNGMGIVPLSSMLLILMVSSYAGWIQYMNDNNKLRGNGK